MRVSEVRGTITLENGEMVQFRLAGDAESSWDGTRETLGHAVDARAAMWLGLADAELFTNQEDY